MKNLQDYIYQSARLYEFRIKLANVDMSVDHGILDRIKAAVDSFQVETISKPKRLPVQKHREFGKIGPCECHVVDLSLRYPTISEQVRQLIIDRAGITADHVCVWTRAQAMHQDTIDQQLEEHDPVLDDPMLADQPGGQDLVGDRRVSGFIKHLSTLKHDIAGGASAAGKTLNNMPQGNNSPVGTIRNKLQSSRKGSKI